MRLLQCECGALSCDLLLQGRPGQRRVLQLLQGAFAQADVVALQQSHLWCSLRTVSEQSRARGKAALSQVQSCRTEQENKKANQGIMRTMGLLAGAKNLTVSCRGPKEASILTERFFTSDRQAMILYRGVATFCIIHSLLFSSSTIPKLDGAVENSTDVIEHT